MLTCRCQRCGRWRRASSWSWSFRRPGTQTGREANLDGEGVVSLNAWCRNAGLAWFSMVLQCFIWHPAGAGLKPDHLRLSCNDGSRVWYWDQGPEIFRHRTLWTENSLKMLGHFSALWLDKLEAISFYCCGVAHVHFKNHLRQKFDFLARH